MQLLATAAASLALLQAPPEQVALPPLPVVHSQALGTATGGSLRGGVPFPAAGETFFTWDPVLHRSPNRVWRRYGTDRTVARVLEVLAAFRAAHPEAPRIGVGDLARPRGGTFDRRFGGLGHASHQNGLDVDVLYPRRDRLERAPVRPAQVDRALAQDLVDRFARTGATYVFVGPRLGLRRIRRSVQTLVHHDDHLHVRFAR